MSDAYETVTFNVRAIKENAAHMRALAHERGFAGIENDIVARAAFERLLQRVSDAARAIPGEWKSRRGDVGWQTVIDLGDVIAEDYDRLDLRHLWEVFETHLDPLEAAVDALTADHARRKASP